MPGQGLIIPEQHFDCFVPMVGRGVQAPRSFRGRNTQPCFLDRSFYFRTQSTVESYTKEPVGNVQDWLGRRGKSFKTKTSTVLPSAINMY
jgi:hypothetical protein